MKQILTFLLLAVVSLGAQAQHHKPHADGVRMHAKELNLTPEQTNKITELRKAHQEQMQQLNRNDSMSVRDMRAKRTALLEQQRAEMMKILSADQQQKLDSLQKKDRGMKHTRKNHQAMHRDRMNHDQLNKQHMQKELSLNEDQIQKMKAMQEKDRAEMQAIQKDSTITEANKKIRLAEIKKQRRKEMEELLTPEQQKKYKEMQRPRGKPGDIQ